MKINLDQTFKTLNGVEIKDEEGKGIKLLTICQNALISAGDQQQKESGEEKAKRYQLAIKLANGGEIELTAEDIAKIKKLIGESYAPIIVGQAYDMLEGK